MRALYHLPLSPYARKVRLVLAEKRLPVELHIEKPWERRGNTWNSSGQERCGPGGDNAGHP